MVFNVEPKIPQINSQDWRLHIDGRVKNPQSFSLGELRSNFESKSVESNIVCLKGATIRGIWKGVIVNRLLSQVQAETDAGWAQIDAYSNYSEPLRLEDLKQDDVILAFELNGKPVPPEQGGLLRLIVPGKYAYKSVKWVKRLKILSQRPGGYWEKKGYPYKDQLQRD